MAVTKLTVQCRDCGRLQVKQGETVYIGRGMLVFDLTCEACDGVCEVEPRENDQVGG